jgi:FdhD protein
MVTRFRSGSKPSRRRDSLAGEEPLEIRVDGTPLAVTMRTPGNDYELAAGFLVSEGAITAASHFGGAGYCRGAEAEGQNPYNVLDVMLGPGVERPATDLARNFYTTSSCGVCGKSSIEAIETKSSFDLASDPTEIGLDQLLELPKRLGENQKVFGQTGGLHAAAIFNASSGELLAVREDVGRHNAVDKVIGWALMDGRLPLTGCVLQVSGRASFELIQKAKMAGIPIFSAVSAPSSLAAELATASEMTLAGFVRGDSLVAYSRPERIRAGVREAVG